MRSAICRGNTTGRAERNSMGWTEAVSKYVTCKYCGVVERGHDCPHKTKCFKKGDKQSDAFRKTKAWTNKSLEIRQRDRYLCQVCLRNLYNTLDFLNYTSVDVHHITPISEDYNKRLDNDNLISLCRWHHKMADDGRIPRHILKKIAEEQNE